MEKFEYYIKQFKKGELDYFDLDELLLEEFKISEEIVEDIFIAHANTEEELLSFLNSFEESNRNEIKSLINDLLDLEKNIIKPLKKIRNLSLPENKNFEHKLKTLNDGSINYDLIKHLEIINEINRDVFTTKFVLKKISTIFPKPEYLNSNFLNLTTYREYNIPFYFMKLIADNFHAQIPFRGKKEIVFGGRKSNSNSINYDNFLAKIQNIIHLGYSGGIKATHITGRQS